nr:hypothetical protein [Saccharothrix syringae]
MGCCPTWRAKEIGSLPLGSTRPSSTSATACPPRMPGLATHSSAASRVDSGSTSGLEASRTTTSGVPVAARASSRAIWPPTRSRVAVEHPSPTNSTRSPTTATTQSASRAAATASAISASSGGLGTTTCGRGWPSGKVSPSGSGARVRMSAPRACTTSQPGGTWARRPSSTVVIISRGWPSGSQSACPDEPAQSPNWVWASSASGPTTAIRRARPPVSGRVPSLRSSTRERRATSRLSAAWSGWLITARCRSASGWRGSSNRPSSNFNDRIRATARSSSASASRPDSTASRAPSKNPGVVMIMSLPARTAAAAAWA